MCWSASASLFSFISGSFLLFTGSSYGIPFPFVLFYFTILFMQFIEYLAWTYPMYNHNISILAITLLCIQPIASMLTIPLPLSKLIYPLIIYLIGLTFVLPLQNPSISIGTDGHLVWNWMHSNGVLPILLYILFLLFPHIISQHWDILIVGCVTLLFSLYRYASYHTWGSIWCWIVHLCIIFSCIKHILTN
jgi:hypothetical protein